MILWPALIGAATTVEGQWTSLSSGATEEIRAILEPEPGVLLCTGSDMHRSLDGGDTWSHWEPTWLGQPMFGYWRDMYFSSGTNGFVVGGMDFNNQFIIARTGDGGTTWTVLDFPTMGNWPLYYTAIEFPTASIGFVCGTFGVMRKSTDGGSTWNTVNTGTAYDLNALHFWSASTGVVVSDGGVLRTTNGGASWGPVSSGGSALHGLAWLPNGEMFTAGDHEFLKSDDSGASWTTLTAPFTGVEEVHALNSDTILVTAQEGMAVTRDGGALWEFFPAPADIGNLFQFHFTSDGTGFVVGGEGTILRTTNAGGPSLPASSFDHLITGACGSSQVDLVATCDPSYSLTWLLNGAVVGTGSTWTGTFTGASNPCVFALVADNGALTDTAFYSTTVNVDQPVTADAGPDVYLCFGTEGQLNGSGGVTFSWSPTTGLDDPDSSDPIVDVTTTTEYVLTVSSGTCSDADAVQVIVEPSVASDVWTTLLDVAGVSGGATSIQMVDHQNGFVAGGGIRRTQDGGATWQVMQASYAGQLSMVDPFHGHLNSGGYTYRTDDGWITRTPETVSPGQPYVTRIHFTSRDTGYALWDNNFDDHILWRTLDGGSSWDTLHYNDQSSLTLFDLEVVSFDTLVLLTGPDLPGYSPRILRSTDAGATWSLDTMTAAGEPLKELFGLPGGALYACGDNGWVARSYDAGLTWTASVITTSGADLTDILFHNPDTGYAVSRNGAFMYKTENGGDCWQLAEPLPATRFRQLSSPGDDRLYFCAPVTTTSGLLVKRTGPEPPRHLGFVMNTGALCANRTLLLANASVGYDSFSWYLDGALFSTEVAPQLADITIGAHEVLLIAFDEAEADSLSRPLNVLDFPTPLSEPVPATVYCHDQLEMEVSTNAGVPGDLYEWSIIGGDETVTNESSTTLTLPIPLPLTLRVTVRAIDDEGCMSAWSDTMSIEQDVDAVMGGPIVGPNQICLATDSTGSSSYTVPASPDTDVVDYLWYMHPPGFGELEWNGTACTAYWDTLYEGIVVINVYPIDACGIGQSSQLNLYFELSNAYTQQPQDQSVDPGYTAQFSIAANIPPSFMRWYHDGAVMPDEQEPTLTLTNVDENDQGYYFARVYSGVCDDIDSDSAYLDVTGTMGLDGTSADVDRLNCRWSDGALVLRSSAACPNAEILLRSISGALIISRQVSLVAGGDTRVHLPMMAHGCYVVELRCGDRTERCQLTVADPR